MLNIYKTLENQMKDALAKAHCEKIKATLVSDAALATLKDSDTLVTSGISDTVSRKQYIPDVGYNNLAVATAFTGDVGVVSNVIKADKAYYIVKTLYKDLVKEIRKYVKRKVNAGLNDAYQFLLPSERTEAKAAAEVSLNTFECLLEKILFGFLDLIGSLVAQAADKIISVAQCLAESIAGTIIGYITAVVNAALDRILGTIQSIISAAGGVLDLVSDVFQFISDIIGLFTCSPRMKCPDNKEIDFWEDNENDVSLNFDNIIATATSVAENFTSIVDPDNFDFDKLSGVSLALSLQTEQYGNPFATPFVAASRADRPPAPSRRRPHGGDPRGGDRA